jgi:hypothetical protein
VDSHRGDCGCAGGAAMNTDDDEPTPMPEMATLLNTPSVFDNTSPRFDVLVALRAHWASLPGDDENDFYSLRHDAQRRFELSLLQQLFDRVAALEAERGPLK